MLGKCLAQNTKKSCENLQSVDNIECIKQFITLEQSVPFKNGSKDCSLRLKEKHYII